MLLKRILRLPHKKRAGSQGPGREEKSSGDKITQVHPTAYCVCRKARTERSPRQQPQQWGELRSSVLLSAWTYYDVLTCTI